MGTAKRLTTGDGALQRGCTTGAIPLYYKQLHTHFFKLSCMKEMNVHLHLYEEFGNFGSIFGPKKKITRADSLAALLYKHACMLACLCACMHGHA